MEKYLIEIFGVYGKGDAKKEFKSFVVNSIDELEDAMKEYEWLCEDDYYKSDYVKFINGELSFVVFPHSGDWDEPNYYSIHRTTLQWKLDEIEMECQGRKQAVYKLFEQN